MHIYDTLIIGSGYTSAGYAVQNKNCVICESTELCDTHFYAALSGFTYHEYTPQTDEGKRLLEICNNLGLISDGMQNLCGFESAFCRYLSEKNVEILLKCRVISVEDSDIKKVTVMTNSGLEAILAKNILNFESGTGEYLTVLFVSGDVEKDVVKLKSVFGEIRYEKAFYPGRYALYVPAENKDINLLKLDIYKKWKESGTSAKILHIPSAAFAGTDTKFCDGKFVNPIKALEEGIFLAKEYEG